MSIPSINKAVIVGRVDEQPKVGTYGEGKKKMSFKVRTERAWRDKNW